jgi:hypothetical protein
MKNCNERFRKNCGLLCNGAVFTVPVSVQRLILLLFASNCHYNNHSESFVFVEWLFIMSSQYKKFLECTLVLLHDIPY